MAQCSCESRWPVRFGLELGIALTLLSSGLQAMAADMHAWQWQRTVVPASPLIEQCLVLDGELYARSAPGLRDVRLIQEGREVAYALEESFDEHSSGGGGAPDRSLFTTVLQVSLRGTDARSGQPSETEGSGVLPARVPVERILFVPASQHAPQTLRAFIPGQSQHFRLVATTYTDPLRPAAPVSEEIEAEITATWPYDLTAVGANLQRSATIDVSVEAGRQTYGSVALQMRQRSLCFQPLSAAPLQLLFGNDAARPARYDYAVHYTPVAMPLLGSMGQTEPNPAYRPATPKRARQVFSKQLLRLLIAVAGVSLLLTLLPLLRQR